MESNNNLKIYNVDDEFIFKKIIIDTAKLFSKLSDKNVEYENETLVELDKAYLSLFFMLLNEFKYNLPTSIMQIISKNDFFETPVSNNDISKINILFGNIKIHNRYITYFKENEVYNQKSYFKMLFDVILSDEFLKKINKNLVAYMFDVLHNQNDKIIVNDGENKKYTLPEKIKNEKFESSLKYANNLNSQKYYNNPAIGRDKELENLMISLLIPEKSPLIIGNAGVGKTSLVEGLSYLIQKAYVPDCLKNQKIYKLNISSIVQGCSLVGDIEKKVEALVSELKNNDDIILFIDEIHNLIGTGAGNKSYNDLANIFKPYLDRGDIKIIGATTINEFDKIINNDSAFRRRFETLKLEEPTREMLYNIINYNIEKLEKMMNISFGYNLECKNIIINAFMDLTEYKNRVHYDTLNNPDLVISLFKKMFAVAAFYNSKIIEYNYIIKSIFDCDCVYESVKSNIIIKLRNELEEAKSNPSEVPVNNIIKFPGKY